MKQFTASEITEGLDLLGDFLDAKGYTEEAGLCTRAMDEINRLYEWKDKAGDIDRVKTVELVDLRAENARLLSRIEGCEKAYVRLDETERRLREALNPFAAVAELSIGESEHDADLFQPALLHPRLIIADFRKARAAMGETE